MNLHQRLATLVRVVYYAFGPIWKCDGYYDWLYTSGLYTY